MDTRDFGPVPALVAAGDAPRARLYTLRGPRVEVDLTDLGARVVAVRAPDRRGAPADVVLGFDDAAGYARDDAYLGATVGRHANRIAGGRFPLDGVTYTLPQNDGPNCLHGGVRAFDQRLWRARDVSTADVPGVTFALISADGDNGFPGELRCEVTFTIDGDELRIDYQATTDRPTVVNLTNHAYFNLAGVDGGPILGHDLTIHATHFTPVDATLVPTGELRPVSGTPFDFTSPVAIGDRIDAADEQLEFGRGYDHNFVLDAGGTALALAATLHDRASGRTLDVLTTEPGLQLYTGNFLDGSVTGKRGLPHRHRHALCLETQHFPDAPNQPGFPSTRLDPGSVRCSTTIYRFTASL
jgi:aldose 1-epimerase